MFCNTVLLDDVVMCLINTTACTELKEKTARFATDIASHAMHQSSNIMATSVSSSECWAHPPSVKVPRLASTSGRFIKSFLLLRKNQFRYIFFC